MHKAAANVTGRKPVGETLPQRLLTTEEVADQLRMSVSALTKWRMRREGPAFVKLGSRVAYQQADVDAFVKASVQRSSEVAA